MRDILYTAAVPGFHCRSPSKCYKILQEISAACKGGTTGVSLLPPVENGTTLSPSTVVNLTWPQLHVENGFGFKDWNPSSVVFYLRITDGSFVDEMLRISCDII
ncbi:hypothetical protein CBL_05574 [Carabus blaptoides fortunei]